jgi:hypothetical protein
MRDRCASLTKTMLSEKRCGRVASSSACETRSLAGFEGALQRHVVDRDAGAAAIEQFGGSAAVGRQQVGSSRTAGVRFRHVR